LSGCKYVPYLARANEHFSVSSGSKYINWDSTQRMWCADLVNEGGRVCIALRSH